MKILICSFENYPQGSGIAHVVHNLQKFFLRKGLDVDVCSPIGSDIKLGNQKLIEKTGGLGIIHFWYKVGKFIKKNKDNYDIILLQQPLIMQGIKGKNIFITTHTTYNEYIKTIQNSIFLKTYYFVMKHVEKFCYKRIGKNILFTCASSSVMDELVSLGINMEKISYIMNGADIDRFIPSDKSVLRKKYKIKNNEIVLLSVGKFRPQKNYHDMIMKFKFIEDRIPNIKLVIIGDGAMLDEIKTFSNNLGIENIEFLGNVSYDTLHEYYQYADYYFTTECYTGHSLAMDEAISSGLPLIAPKLPAFIDIVEGSGSGIIFNSDYDIINYIKNSDSKTESIKCRKYAEENLNWDTISDKYIKLFRKC